MEWLFLLDTIRCEVGLVIVCIAAVSCWDLLLLLNSCGTHWIFSKPYFAYLAMQIKAIFGKVLYIYNIQYTYIEKSGIKNFCMYKYYVHVQYTYTHRRLTISIKMLGYWIYMINGNGTYVGKCIVCQLFLLSCEAELYSSDARYIFYEGNQANNVNDKEAIQKSFSNNHP